MINAIRGSVRLFLYLCLTLAMIPWQILFLLLRLPLVHKLPMFYHRLTLWCYGINLRIEGKPVSQHCLFVSNHTSFADIPVLGSLINGCFVAKSEVASWPLFGFLAKLQRSVFIDRRRSQSVGARNKLAERLKAGDNLILFPEGTSSDGCRVLPFRPALFDSVLSGDAGSCVIQPVAMLCVAENGLSAGRVARQNYAWFGDMTLVPSLFKLASRPSTTVRVRFLPPLVPKDFSSRRALAQAAETSIAENLKTE